MLIENLFLPPCIIFLRLWTASSLSGRSGRLCLSHWHPSCTSIMSISIWLGGRPALRSRRAYCLLPGRLPSSLGSYWHHCTPYHCFINCPREIGILHHYCHHSFCRCRGAVGCQLRATFKFFESGVLICQSTAANVVRQKKVSAVLSKHCDSALAVMPYHTYGRVGWNG